MRTHIINREEWDKMTPKQKQQYEFYRRSMFNRKVVRCVSKSIYISTSSLFNLQHIFTIVQVMKKVTEKRLDEKMVLIASACAKMFVGDVVEKGTKLPRPLSSNCFSL